MELRGNALQAALQLAMERPAALMTAAEALARLEHAL